MLEIACALCGAKKMRATGEVNRAAKKKAPLYCSRACMGAAKKTESRALGWHERRFEPRRGTVEKACVECGRSMWLPPSKADEYQRCGVDCVEAGRARNYTSLVRSCETCGCAFRPRPTQVRKGGGSFCSQKCNLASHQAMNSAAGRACRLFRMREIRERGEWTILSGEKNPRWSGGAAAAKKRRVESGKAAAGLRAYRSKNRDKVREWKHRRGKGKVLSRLPWGTIPRIGGLQKWRCAICLTNIRKGYHLDHITPLARGGLHLPANLQLLCGPCNLRKSAKDPIAHMQELGRLL